MKCQECSNCFVCSSMQDIQSNYEQYDREELLRRFACLHKLNDSLQVLIEDLPDTFFVTDGDGTILMVNKAYEKLSGTKREEIIGRNMRDYQGDVISRSSTLLVIKTGREATLEQIHYRTGRKSFTTSKPVWRNGKIMFIVSSNRDFNEITQLQVELEQEKMRASSYLRELQNIRSVLLEDHQIIANDKTTLAVLRRTKKAAMANIGVLLTGETGTGKSEFAKFIHRNSDRRDKPFLTIDCGAIAASLIESELFGYEKGAFTGARAEGHKGLLELGNGGTIFLDEVGELSLDMQVKLLRVLQEQEFYRVGGNKPIKMDVRFISATNGNLQKMVAEKMFREDLYYRLSSVPIHVPPLRERRADIVPLATHFLQVFNEKHGTNKRLSSQAYQQLKGYGWPGNIRELKNVLEEAVIMSDSSVIEPSDILSYERLARVPQQGKSILLPEQTESFNMTEYMERIELHLYQDAYCKGGSVRKAAELLQVSASTYARRLKALESKYGESANTPADS